MKEVANIEELELSLGKPLATSPWETIDQSRIDAFAEVTGDHQWIHLDSQRAASESVFGSTIAHGFLTLSLIPKFAGLSYQIQGFGTKVNYGLNKVRFLQPVTVNSRVRGHFQLTELTDKGDGRYLLLSTVTIELEGNEKPACVAEMLTLLLP